LGTPIDRSREVLEAATKWSHCLFLSFRATAGRKGKEQEEEGGMRGGASDRAGDESGQWQRMQSERRWEQ
jgi:hypothetical protein